MLHVFREIRLFSTCRIQAIPAFETDLKYDSFTGFNQRNIKNKEVSQKLVFWDTLFNNSIEWKFIHVHHHSDPVAK